MLTTSSSRPSEVVAAGSAEEVICGPLPTSDNIEEEEGVALFREDGTADVELGPTRSGGWLVSGGTASIAERYREEMKCNLNLKHHKSSTR